MSLEQRYKRLKQTAERLSRESLRAQGQLDSVLADLKKEFGCETIVEAHIMLKQLEHQERKERTEFEQALAAFETEWDSESKGD